MKPHELAAILSCPQFPEQYKKITGKVLDSSLTPQIQQQLTKSSYDVYWITKPPPTDYKHMHLFILAKNGNTKTIFDYIHSNGKASVNTCDTIKRIPLHVAAAHANINAI